MECDIMGYLWKLIMPHFLMPKQWQLKCTLPWRYPYICDNISVLQQPNYLIGKGTIPLSKSSCSNRPQQTKYFQMGGLWLIFKLWRNYTDLKMCWVVHRAKQNWSAKIPGYTFVECIHHDSKILGVGRSVNNWWQGMT